MRVLAMILLAGCAADSTRLLCSESLDHAASDPGWFQLAQQIRDARAHHEIVLVHGHKPGPVLPVSSVEKMFELAAHERLPVIRYDEMATATEGGLAFAIDDNAMDEWYALRPIFAHYGVHITFFVSRWDQQPPQAIDELLQLAADGHELEPHTVNHLEPLVYVKDHGLDAWLADEVDPSIDIMRQHGIEPSFFAYPFGERDAAMDRALLERVDAVRSSGHYCR